MNAQLEGLSTGEIRELIEEANAILTEREAEERRVQAEQKRVSRGEGGSWLEHELVNCGNCRRCADGDRHHGPYWYLYRYTGSRMVSTYVGRTLPQETAQRLGNDGIAGMTPEQAFPDAYSKRPDKEM